MVKEMRYLWCKSEVGLKECDQRCTGVGPKGLYLRKVSNFVEESWLKRKKEKKAEQRELEFRSRQHRIGVGRSASKAGTGLVVCAMRCGRRWRCFVSAFPPCWYLPCPVTMHTKSMIGLAGGCT